MFISSTQNRHGPIPQLENPPRTEPKTLMGKAFPCQRQAAALRDKALADIVRGDTGLLAYRYLQCRAGQHNTRQEAAIHCAGASACIVLVGTAAGSMVFGNILAPVAMGVAGSAACITAGQAYVDFGNTGRYRKTKRLLKQALREKINDEQFMQIQAMRYKNLSFCIGRLTSGRERNLQSVIEVLEQLHIDTALLRGMA